MARPRTLIRVLTALLALLQAVVPASASIADARLVAVSATLAGTTHIEDHGSSDCPRSHPIDCAMCQYASATFLPSAPNAELLAATRAVALPHGPAEHRRAAAALWQPPSRAPPASLTL